MDLSVSTREKFGKAVKSLRRDGVIPAELYGRGVKNLHLSVSAKDFSKVFKEAGTNTIVGLLVGKSKLPVLIHEVGRDYMTDDVTHVDFYQVQMDEKLKARIPLEFLGEAPAAKDKGGILNKSMLEVEVEALPGDLPRRLNVDLSALSELNESIYVKDVAVPKGVEILTDPGTVIATVTPPVAEEKEEKVETPVDVSAVKVETEEKKAEREAGKVNEDKEKK